MGSLPLGLRGPVDVALAKADSTLPTGKPGRWVYELKWDGFRCAAVVTDAGARLWSRQGKDLTEQFPDIRDAVTTQVPAGTVLDGELVIWNGAGLDFDLLQRRLVNRGAKARALAAATPATYMVFDVMAADGTDLRDHVWTNRRDALEGLGAEWAPPVQVSPQTGDPGLAAEWAAQYRPAGIEGLMAKSTDGRYRPGRRDWIKVKTRETTEVIVGAVTGTLDRPEAIVLGRYQGDRLVMVGRSTPLNRTQAAALAPLLRPAKPEHPWPDTIIANRFGSSRERVRIVKVEPVVVAEVSADTGMHGVSFRHSVRFVRARLDLAVSDVPSAGE